MPLTAAAARSRTRSMVLDGLREHERGAGALADPDQLLEPAAAGDAPEHDDVEGAAADLVDDAPPAQRDAVLDARGDQLGGGPARGALGPREGLAAQLRAGGQAAQ